jgi:hypothetical protein
MDKFIQLEAGISTWFADVPGLIQLIFPLNSLDSRKIQDEVLDNPLTFGIALQLVLSCPSITIQQHATPSIDQKDLTDDLKVTASSKDCIPRPSISLCPFF